MEIYVESIYLLSRYRFRLSLRRFVHDLFDMIDLQNEENFSRLSEEVAERFSRINDSDTRSSSLSTTNIKSEPDNLTNNIAQFMPEATAGAIPILCGGFDWDPSSPYCKSNYWTESKVWTSLFVHIEEYRSVWRWLQQEWRTRSQAWSTLPLI